PNGVSQSRPLSPPLFPSFSPPPTPYPNNQQTEHPFQSCRVHSTPYFQVCPGLAAAAADNVAQQSQQPSCRVGVLAGGPKTRIVVVPVRRLFSASSRFLRSATSSSTTSTSTSGGRGRTRSSREQQQQHLPTACVVTCSLPYDDRTTLHFYCYCCCCCCC
ncbi:hypothetical protein CAOG_09092, partial [Capsaspora owczarzaki ATCC 30864]|uniref:hypothetical protein n=1 Tax=Capsaspora owczarzaki (strain ATCC 30864) TaxID=595528 RepID=UPI0003526D0F